MKRLLIGAVLGLLALSCAAWGQARTYPPRPKTRKTCLLGSRGPNYGPQILQLLQQLVAQQNQRGEQTSPELVAVLQQIANGQAAMLQNQQQIIQLLQQQIGRQGKPGPERDEAQERLAEQKILDRLRALQERADRIERRVDELRAGRPQQPLQPGLPQQPLQPGQPQQPLQPGQPQQPLMPEANTRAPAGMFRLTTYYRRKP